MDVVFGKGIKSGREKFMSLIMFGGTQMMVVE